MVSPTVDGRQWCHFLGHVFPVPDYRVMHRIRRHGRGRTSVDRHDLEFWPSVSLASPVVQAQLAIVECSSMVFVLQVFRATPVTGSNVLVATVTFAGCPAGSSGFVMDLDSGDDVFGTSVSHMVDKNNDAYYFG